MSTEKSKDSLEKWRQIVTEKMAWGPVNGWGDYDFEELSNQIFSLTQTRLSVSTLKRVLGKVRYDSIPNLSTLNVLASFLGYADWRAFNQQVEQPGDMVEPLPPTITDEPLPLTKREYDRRWLMVVLFLAVVGMVAWGLLKSPIKNREISSSFSSRKIVDGLPNSVVFDYDASGFHSDSVYIQQSWDPERIEKVPGEGKQHTSIYYYPGFFIAKLLVDGKLIKETNVFIPSKGWVGIIDHKPVPTYLDSSEMHAGGFLGITESLFAQKTGSPVFNDNWIRFYNIRNFEGLTGDDLQFAATLRNSSQPNQSACRHVNIYIIGNSNVIIIPLSDKGCTATLDLHTGEEWIAGKEHDLGKFGCDFSTFHNITCSVTNHRLAIRLDEQLIFQITVTQPIGNIIGLAVAFEGAGEIKDIQLGNSNKIFYNSAK